MNLESLPYAGGVLSTLTVEEAKRLQFQLVDTISRHFSGEEWYQQGDVGLHPDFQRPRATAKVEQVLAEFFGAEAAALVRGAGTGAIRSLLSWLLSPGESLFMHQAPVYTTTKEIIRMLHLQPIFTDYNDLAEVEKVVEQHPECRLFYIQHARQQPQDTYQLDRLISCVRTVRHDCIIVVDDNYCALKVARTGVQAGADYSAFSGFKLLGPEGIGVIVGHQEAIEGVHRINYSGGGQVQGWEAMELLRSIVFAPVSLAVQGEQVEELCRRLNEGEVPGIRLAYITNAQSKNVNVELEEPIAGEVIAASESLGAAVYPVGAESRYEILPMIYRVSGSFLEARPELADCGLRINPMKSGADTVIRILQQAIEKVQRTGKQK
ncbi:aminotransferase class V-fold PLP-dependent enzyme [Paenactinomyces guangxiensis]|uniref:Aminotransferase class V-fold PLP-dependent enzyme n=1 Tax=Paenactinomyces guangxiensis TaxID=1490290 RepID=A0A7W1WNN9_9BACL|nr:aminotransferase class V-fold PLP-dependent enzyme [Paenactinomyces guangxiensis]MBA4493222.1 aminotransferase class V-fold PLP-dependent enzyme [Paenactinomyces guangxiensis]MBH8589928.1 aminotransferase class V-fold PLP-dependent enzyme [Paenactinomyces guangxiensis]